MPLSPAFLEELRARLPLSGIANKKLRLQRAGREFKACCPFHNEKTPSFYINDDKQFYHCFGCGAHGDVIGWTMRMDHLSFPEAIETLAAQAGLAIPQDTPVERERYDREKRLYQLLERTTGWFEEQLTSPQGREGLNYLRSRGLSDEAMKRFHLGYAPHDAQALIRALIKEGFSIDEMLAVGLIKKSEDRNGSAGSHPGAGEHFSFFRNRVIFPVGDRRGRTVAFGARILGDGEPKYLNSPDHALFHKGKLLYGLSRARAALAQNQPIIVVEGYMDVIALVEAGYQGAVAPLGTALTEDQIAILWKLLPPPDARDPTRDYNPILCFDGDNAGRRAAARAVERALPFLSSSQTTRIAYLPEGEDPDSLIRQSGRSGMQAVLDQSKHMIDAIWDLALEGRRLQTPEDRGSFIGAIRQRISRIQDEALRKLYQDEIQKRLSEAFQWQNTTGNKTFGRKDFSRDRKPLQRPLSAGPRKKPQKASLLREKVLLAIIINHPSLFAEFGEELARIWFSSPSLESLRQQVVNLLGSESQEPLDAPELYRHLSTGDAAKAWAKGLSETLSQATYLHASFARPECMVDQARQGWKSIWNKYLQELLQADLQAAKRQHDEDPSEKNLTRLTELRAQVQALMQESALHEPVNGAIVDGGSSGSVSSQ
jgi:DNA primase